MRFPFHRRRRSWIRWRDGGLTEAASMFDTPAVRQLRTKLLANLDHNPTFDWATFDEACDFALSKMADLPLCDQPAYLDFHRRRFFQLDNLAGELARGREPLSILDVGISVNTLVLGRLFPSASVATLDRNDIHILTEQPFRLLNVDLTDPDLDQQSLDAKFDIILFAEVLEHLLANPVRVLSFLIRHLTPSGYLIVTTPNFFSAAAMWRLHRLENPQPVFPASLRRGEEISHHVREYSMSELLLMSAEAGGRPASFFFAAPWEENPPEIPELGSNLTAIIQPAS